MRRGRRARLIGLMGATAAVLAASNGWACVQAGSHTGFTWVCKATSTVTCNYDGGLSQTDGRNTNPTHSLNFYSQSSGLTNNGSYDVRYVAGDHSADTDATCHSGTIFAGGANIIASSTGSWSGKGPMTMPNATGIHTICVQTLAGNDPNNFLGSGHVLWTLM